MSKPVELITTLEGEDAKRFLRNLENPPKNKAWKRTLKRAKRLQAAMDHENKVTSMYIERIVKLQIPVEPSRPGRDGLSYFEEVVMKHGRHISMKDIKKAIDDRFGA